SGRRASCRQTARSSPLRQPPRSTSAGGRATVGGTSGSRTVGRFATSVVSTRDRCSARRPERRSTPDDPCRHVAGRQVWSALQGAGGTAVTLGDDRWVEVTKSQFDHETAGLEIIRKLLD